MILASNHVLILFMSFAHAIADTPHARAHLRLVVLAQWIRAGLALIRGTTTDRGLVGGAVALWRLAQAVRLAILLARRLAEAQSALRSGAQGATSTPLPAWSLEPAPLDDDALRRALAELDAAMTEALGVARHGQTRVEDRERPARIHASASQAARGRGRRRLDRRTQPLGRRPLRPPGPARADRRRSRTPHTPNTAPPPIAALAIGRPALAEASPEHGRLAHER